MVTLYKVDIRGKSLECYPIDGLCAHKMGDAWVITHMRNGKHGKVLGLKEREEVMEFASYDDACWAMRVLTRKWDWSGENPPCSLEDALVALGRKVREDEPERAICLT